MKRCIACGRALPDERLFELCDAPASAQDIPDANQIDSDRGVTLDLYQCCGCGLVQFDCAPVSYYKDVIRAGGFSTTMTGLRRRQYRHLIDTYHLEGKKFLEVGCGRGEFIKVLTEFPVEVYGIEHKADLVTLAQEAGLHVWQDFAGDPGRELTDGTVRGPYDVFLSFNFLEHQPEPGVMLQTIYNNLAEDGMGLVTVPALEYILEQGSYYELIRDHIAYYSFDSLRALLNRYGFEVLEEELVNRDTIAMIVRKMPELAVEDRPGFKAGGSADKTGVQAAGGAAAEPSGETDAETPEFHPVDITPLLAGYSRVKEELDHLIKHLHEEGGKLAIWGASHQGFTLAATLGLAGRVEYIIDSAPFKQGRYAPASHLPIVAPDHYFESPVDAVLIVAPGYTEEIAGVIRQRYGTGVRVWTLRTDHIEAL